MRERGGNEVGRAGSGELALPIPTSGSSGFPVITEWFYRRSGRDGMYATQKIIFSGRREHETGEECAAGVLPCGRCARSGHWARADAMR